MEKWNRFLAKNSWFSYTLMGITLASVWFYYFSCERGLVFAVIFSFLAAFIYCLVPVGAANKLTIKTIKKLDDECDPYPMLLETESQLSYVKNANRRQLCIINRATALSCMGRYSEAYGQLCAIDIDELPGTTPDTKAIYYANLSSHALGVGEFQQSVSYHAKASQMTSLLKNPKVKDILFSSLRATSAEQAIESGEYQTALELVRSIEVKAKRQSVNNAFLYAKIALAQGDKENARANLLYVINNGNKLGCVVEAKKLLETL